ncbi:glutathione synthase [Saccharophagus degradans]|uniref:Glutathione synthetase n=2 Tax=Saccharophagus degradans TaxID=86304 RepID=A0AAW7XB30_9GAMM|nr:glutathione synthase [Saccharophagus degradans]MDO6423559.1 glutathione synthase [Saccharophagus degradans]MDO6607769.1 glutathione synthase [Saccharophagus degradans]WGO98926.1 glutathione synthase [Saccharophagus degradans]
MHRPLNIGVVMDPIASITYYKDTTLALLQAAQARGHNLTYMEMPDLYLEQGVAKARTRPLTVFDNAQQWYQLGSFEDKNLADLDVILMRKDPPFDNQFIYATYILERAENDGCLVVNKPQSLRDCNEKVFATAFPECCPPVLVSRDPTRLRAFHAQHQDVIFKPLDGMGGSGIFRCKHDDPNVSVILETLTLNSAEFIMAQKYLAEIKQGDKRILVVNGEAIPYSLARIPASGETRGNLAAGGTGVAQPLTERDQWIVDQVAPTLVEKGLLFVGLDVIGDYLTEINVTSPTCVREIDKAFNTNIGEKLVIALENKRQ